MQPKLSPGQSLPDYELPDHTRALVIHSAYNRYWFWGRPSMEYRRGDLRAVTSEIRPDWDLSAPGLREAWEAGGHSAFHGWSKWSPDRIAAEREIATTR